MQSIFSTFETWLKYGIEQKWVGVPVCSSHDGIPTSEEEDLLWEEGSDPCIHVMRLYESEEVAEAVDQNFTPYRWRKGGA